MKNKFKQLPAILQRQILTRLVLGGFFILLFIILIFTTKDIVLALPCVILGLYLVINGGAILFNCLVGKVITVSGKCVEIQHSRIFKRVKSIYIQTEDKELKIPIRKKMRELTIGVTINVYIPEKATVYEKDGKFATGTFYAVEMKR